MEPEHLVNWWYAGDTSTSVDAKQFNYVRYYLLDDTIDLNFVCCLSEEVFNQLIDYWNILGDDKWKYYKEE